jgi:hypothetical protein
MTDFAAILRLFSDAEIEFILVGGAAAAAHGAVRLTLDLDVVYRRSPENLQRIADALAKHNPYPRGAPKGLPFKWDNRTLSFGVNFTLVTDLGLIDLLGEITGGGSYDDLLPYAVEVEAFGAKCLCLNLESLIRVKNAAGRPKDYEAIAELEAIAEEQRRS